MEKEQPLNFDFGFDRKVTNLTFDNLFKRLKLQLKKSNIEGSDDFLKKLKNSRKNLVDIIEFVSLDENYKNSDIFNTCLKLIDLLYNSSAGKYVSDLNNQTRMVYVFYMHQVIYGKKYFPDYKIISTDYSLEDFRKIFAGFCRLEAADSEKENISLN